jgi:hypothetical protein
VEDVSAGLEIESLDATVPDGEAAILGVDGDDLAGRQWIFFDRLQACQMRPWRGGRAGLGRDPLGRPHAASDSRRQNHQP